MLYSITIALCSTLLALSAHATDVTDFTFNGKISNYSLSLDGTKTSTVYRTEEYEGTCSREEAYTDYREECDYQNIESCHEEGGGQSCQSVPSCTDVSRPVCNSNGCTDYSTRECTTSESCTSEPSRTVCSTQTVSTNCRSIPYTAYHTVEYGCTKTRQVPVGIQTDELLSAAVSIEFTGTVRDLTGKDRFKLSVANGNDLARPDLVLEMNGTGDSHFFRLVKKDETKQSIGEKKSLVTAYYQIDVVPVSSVTARKTTIGDLDAIRGALSFTTSGERIDASSILTVQSKKDRLIGGLAEVFEGTFDATQMKVSENSTGQNVQVGLGDCLNRRPHEFTLMLTRDVKKIIGEGVMNLSTIEKAQKAMASTFSKRINLKGKKRDQCAPNQE